jgi:adenylate cyclase
MIGRFSRALVVGLTLTLLVGIGLHTGAFFLWHKRLSDTLFLVQKPSSQIVIAAVDDKSIQAIGRWPWDRSVHADLIDRLSKLGVRVIGMDITFSEVSSKDQDSRLQQAISESQAPVILAAEGQNLRVGETGVGVELTAEPLASFAPGKESYGIINLIPERDGIIRSAPIKVVTREGESVNSFSLAILQAFYEKTGKLSDFEQKVSDIKLDQDVMLINFTGPPGNFPTYSVSDILEGRIDDEEFENKIVLVGATVQDLHDDAVTPTSGKPMSGVEMHSNILNTLIEERYLVQESKTVSFLIAAGMALGLSLLFVLLPLKGVMMFGLVSLVVYFIFAFISFDQGIVRHLIYPPVVIVASTISNVGYKYLVEQRQKRFIRKAMAYYLSPAVMAEVLSEPSKLQLGGQRKVVSVLFSDITGFTSISEEMPAEDLSHLVNQYLTAMTEVIFEYRGVLDKYIGDAVMAFWGAPVEDELHALNAVKAAVKMQEEAKKLVKGWRKNGVSNFHIRIGINTGEAVVGNMGSKLRFDYTVIGDAVNLGSRLEGLNKQYGTRMLISKMTYDQVKDQVVARKLDIVMVKGKRHGVVVYELRGLGEPKESERRFLEKFEKARKLYEKGWFGRAYKAFRKLHTEYPKDGPIKTYLKRCRGLKKDRPRKWDGIYKAVSK